MFFDNYFHFCKYIVLEKYYLVVFYAVIMRFKKFCESLDSKWSYMYFMSLKSLDYFKGFVYKYNTRLLLTFAWTKCCVVEAKHQLLSVVLKEKNVPCEWACGHCARIEIDIEMQQRGRVIQCCSAWRGGSKPFNMYFKYKIL